MKGIENFLRFLNENYVSIMICLGLIIGLTQKIYSFFKKSKDEQLEIVKSQIHEIILRLITSAEMDFDQWNEAGEIKRAQVINDILGRFDILNRVTNQEEIIAFIDNEINESLKTLRKIVKENDGVPTPTA